jgi:hypothetical protein
MAAMTEFGPTGDIGQIEIPQRSSAVLSFRSEAWEGPAVNRRAFITLLGSAATARPLPAAIRAASTGRTRDRTRPMLHQRKKALVNPAPST